MTRPRREMDRWVRRGAVTTPLLGLFLKSLEIDPTQVRQRVAAGVLDEADLLLVLVQDLDREAERLKLLDQHLEGLRNARRLDLLALDDRLVRLHAAHHIVALDGEQLLEDGRRALSVRGPALHLVVA